MSNPLRVLQSFDRHLTGPAEMTLFGRAALALGFSSAPPDFHNTRDVDAILSLEWLALEGRNTDFWLAQQKANVELAEDGLYLTHLFRESDVILRPEWLSQRIRLPLHLAKLAVYRPAIIDLILTKMARCDEQDLEDIRFLLIQEPISPPELQAAFTRARVPDVEEIRQLFVSAQPKVLKLAGSIAQ
jgi:hypothetical protein